MQLVVLLEHMILTLTACPFLHWTCLLQRWCQETFGEIRAINSMQMYDDHMTWLAAKKAGYSTCAVVEIWHRARRHIATLAAFHGYLPSFDWRDSEVAKYELSQLVHDNSIAQAADTDGRTVRQERPSLSPEQLQLLYTYAMGRSAAECALLLAFCGIMGQSLARSGQICKMNRVHISYSEANVPVTPLFGPVRLLHLGDRGHHKVNKTQGQQGTLGHAHHETFSCLSLVWACSQDCQTTQRGTV